MNRDLILCAFGLGYPPASSMSSVPRSRCGECRDGARASRTGSGGTCHRRRAGREGPFRRSFSWCRAGTPPGSCGRGCLLRRTPPGRHASRVHPIGQASQIPTFCSQLIEQPFTGQGGRRTKPCDLVFPAHVAGIHVHYTASSPGCRRSGNCAKTPTGFVRLAWPAHSPTW